MHVRELKLHVSKLKTRRQRGSVVRAKSLSTEDPGSNPRLGQLNVFVVILGANSPRFVRK